MKLLTRAQALGKKLTLISTAFILAVSTLTAVVPFVLSEKANAVSTVNVNDLSKWWFEDKANGRHELVASGLHVWTLGGSTDGSNRKSAGYTPVAPFPLANAADADIQFAGTPTGPLPSLQLGVDRDGNGTWDGYLVYEPSVYGAGKFWIDKPGFGVAPGQGYQSFGTIAEFAAANQDAKVISVGYSLGTLGNHPDGDSVISKLKVGGTTYNFADTTSPTITINGATSASKVYPAGTVRIQVSDTNYDKTVIQKKDANGNYVDHFTYDASKGKSFKIDWLGDGEYRVQAFDTAGNASKVLTFAIDTTAPETTFNTPAAGQTVGHEFTLSGTAKDNIGLNRVYVQLVNRENSQRYAGHTVHLSGTQQDWSYVVNANDLNLPEGTYAAHVSVTDNAGNSSTVGWTANFKLNKTGPVASKVRLNGVTVAGQYQRNNNCDPINKLYLVGGTLNVTSVIDDTNGVANASYSVRKLLDNGCTDTATYKSATIALEKSTKNPSNWNQPAGAVLNTATEGLNGQYTIVLVTNDGVGNKTVKYVDLDIDNTKPTVKVNLDRNGYLDNGGVTRKAATPEIEAFDTNLTEIKITDQNGNEVTHWGNGKSSVTPGATTYKGIGWLGEGTYNIYAYDKVGNVSDVFTFTIDNTPPQLSVDAPADLVTYGATLDVTGTVFDNNLSEYKYQILDENKQNTLGSEGWSRLGGNSNATGTLFTADISNLPNGTYYISVWATDKAGNATNQSGNRLEAPYIMQFTINRDVTALINTIARNTATPTISGILTRNADGSAIANTDVVVTIDGTKFTTTTNASGIWSVKPTVAAGTHTVTVAFAGANPIALPLASTSFTTVLADPNATQGDDGDEPAAPADDDQSTANLPTTTGPTNSFAAILGTGTEAASNNNSDSDTAGNPAVEGASTEKNLAEAVNNTDGKAFGLAWYWWLLILAAVATLLWWIIAAVRRRQADDV